MTELDPVVIIPCGSAKLDVPTVAADLYIGGLFRMALRAARALTPDDRIRVLSGRHGLVRLDTVVAPYDQRIDKPGAVTSAELRTQAASLPVGPIIALLPIAYADALTAAGISCPNWLAGSRGIGVQRQRLVAITKSAAMTAAERIAEHTGNQDWHHAPSSVCGCGSPTCHDKCECMSWEVD